MIFDFPGFIFVLSGCEKYRSFGEFISGGLTSFTAPD